MLLMNKNFRKSLTFAVYVIIFFLVDLRRVLSNGKHATDSGGLGRIWATLCPAWRSSVLKPAHTPNWSGSYPVFTRRD